MFRNNTVRWPAATLMALGLGAATVMAQATTPPPAAAAPAAAAAAAPAAPAAPATPAAAAPASTPAATPEAAPAEKGRKGKLAAAKRGACERVKAHAETTAKNLTEAREQLGKCPEAKKADATKLLDEAQAALAAAEKSLGEKKCLEARKHLRQSHNLARKARRACGAGARAHGKAKPSAGAQGEGVQRDGPP